MTKGERTQLGWIGFAAISRRRRHRHSTGGKVIVWMIAFMLGCWLLAGAASLVQKFF